MGRDVKIPNGDRAELDRKIEEYVLDPWHREGRHKARVFEAVLGITMENRDVLIDALRSIVRNSPDAKLHGHNGHGEVYLLRFPLVTERGAATVLSAWIIRDGEDFPRLVTCYIL
ncbi:MAG: DUF6883 domain-containing protein [Candidatus Binatia bacterium]